MDDLAMARDQLRDFDRYVSTLHHRARSVAEASPIAAEALEGLSTALEELRVGEEELRVQNDELHQTGHELEVERHRYRQLFDLAPDAYLVTDHDGVIMEANLAASRLLRARVERLLGKPISVFIPSEGRRAFRRDLRERASRTGEWEFSVQPHGGPPVPVACTLVYGRDESLGTPTLLWLVRDVSARKAAEDQEAELGREHVRREAAESARTHVDAILRNLPIAVIIAEAPSGRMITYNPATEALFGYPPPLAESAEEYSDVYRGLHPDGRAYEVAEWPLTRAVRRGERVHGEEIELVHPDGARRVFRVSAAPVRDAEGRIVAAVCGLHDITEEKRRGETRRFLGEVSDVLATSLDYQETVQRIAELACRALADYAAVYVQEEDGAVRGLGYAASDPNDEEALRYLMRGVPKDAGSDHPIIAAMRTGEPRIVAGLTDEGMRAMAGDAGRLELIRHLELECLLIAPLIAAGRTLGVIALARRAGACAFDDADVALAQEIATRAAHAVDNARLYLVAQRTARMHEETIGIVSHDLRNALNAALMNTELVLDEELSGMEVGPEGRKQLVSVRRSLTHMQRLVQDLLEVDRMDRGRLSIHLEPLAPASLVEELHGWLGPLARGAGLTWEVDIPGEIPTILADHARLIQIFSNLVGNAVQATPRGGSVTVRAESTATEVCFHVRDSGSGIDAASLPRIFDRFFQAPARGKGGSGLGLTISRGLVEAQGGRMWAASRIGEGSTFSFALPIGG